MVLEILIVCAATDESIKTKGLSWESPQVLWLLALLLTSVVYLHHLPNPNPNSYTKQPLQTQILTAIYIPIIIIISIIKKIQLRFVTFVWWPQQQLCFFSTKNNNKRGLRLSQAPGMFFFSLYFFYFSLTTNDYFIDALSSLLPSTLPTFKREDEGLRVLILANGF